MRVTLNLNAAATQVFVKDATKVRVKMEDGILMIKPTDRVCGKALPKGEKLLKLTRKDVSSVKFSLRGFDGLNLVAGQKVGLVDAKRGWLALSPSLDGVAAVRVSNS
jgi:hypothetical protein